MRDVVVVIRDVHRVLRELFSVLRLWKKALRVPDFLPQGPGVSKRRQQARLRDWLSRIIAVVSVPHSGHVFMARSPSSQYNKASTVPRSSSALQLFSPRSTGSPGAVEWPEARKNIGHIAAMYASGSCCGFSGSNFASSIYWSYIGEFCQLLRAEVLQSLE